MSELATIALSPPTAKRKFEFNLEALRGFAAFIVVFGHAVTIPLSLDPAYTPYNKWGLPLPGHSSVLLFFILSGYVIGLTNQTALTRPTIVAYLRKRLLRLYPIYVLSLLLALMVATRHYSFLTIAGNFLFLQNGAVPLIWENNPLWSLNSEVLYYLAFIPVSYFNVSTGKVWLATILVGMLCGTVLPLPLLSSYSFGFTFWVSGLWLAQHPSFIKQYASPISLAGLALLFLGYAKLNPFITAVVVLDSKLHIHFAEPAGVALTFGDLFQLPFCFYLFLRFTNQTIKWDKQFIAATIASGLLFYGYMTIRYDSQAVELTRLLTSFIVFLLGSLLIGFSYLLPSPQQAVSLPEQLIKLGGISYGIYVIHFPISSLLARIPVFSGTLTTFCCRLALDVLLVLAAAHLLERKFQPWFRKQLKALNAQWV